MTRLLALMQALSAVLYPVATAAAGVAAAATTVGGILSHASPVAMIAAGELLGRGLATLGLIAAALQGHLLP